MKKIFALVFFIMLALAGYGHAVDLDFDQDDDSKIDSLYLDMTFDVTGAVKFDGAGTASQATVEDLSNYNAIDPDYLTGDTTDDNLIDVGVINTTALKVTLSTDDLVTLSGRSEGATHLGTFTGDVIDDNLTMKAALQDLETYVESLGGGHDPVTLSTDLNSNLLGLSTQQLTLDSQAINVVFAGPASGASGAPSFRSLVAADIPDISATYQTLLSNEAGLYSALSDVSDFTQPGDTVRTNSGTSLPASCTVGDIFLDTDADTDGTVYVCVATDTWKDIDDDGSTGSDVLAKVSSNETDADYLVNQIGSSNGEIDVSETGTGDETLNLAIDVTPSAGSATLEVAEDAIQVKYKAADFSEGADGLEIDYTNGQAAATGVKGFLTGTDWDTFNAKEDDTHASEHAMGGADTVFPVDPNFNGLLTWDDTAGALEWGTSADLSYDGSTWSVVDDSHAHVYSNIDAFTEANLYTLLSDVTQFYEPGDAASLASVTFTDEDASPNAAGMLKYDNTITGLIDGGLVWYDDDEIQLIVSVPMTSFGTGPTDDYVIAYDAINDEHYYVESSGVGGNTKFNLIEDADADGTIALGAFEQTITTTLDESGGVMWTLNHTDSDGLTNDFYFIEMIHANDGDAQGHFMRGLDNTSDELWKITYDGTIYAKQFETTGANSAPGFTAKDADNPGADKEIGKLTWNYLSGTDGAEDGSFALQLMIAGTERTYFEGNADEETLTLGDSTTGEDLVYDFDTGTANQVTASSNSGVNSLEFQFDAIRVGVNDTKSGDIYLYGDGSSGGQVIIYMDADLQAGAGFDNYIITTNQDDFSIYAGANVKLQYDRGLDTWGFADADVELPDDTVDNDDINWGDLTYLADEGQPTAPAVGLASANLDDTDASIEWEDAAALDSDGSLSDGSVDALSVIAAAIRSGSDAKLITGTAGTNTYTAAWNADGDLVDGYDPTSKANVADVDVEMLIDVTGEGTAATYALFDDNDGTYSFRAIAAGDIPNDLIDSQHYAAASIDNEHLADDAVDSAELASNSVDDDHLNTTDVIEFMIDGGGSAISTGVKGYIEIPFACTITQLTILSDVSTSSVVDIWKDTYANYPPVDADSITASAPPTITTALKNQDSTLTGWTTSVTAGDILGYNVDSNDNATLLTIALKVTR